MDIRTASESRRLTENRILEPIAKLIEKAIEDKKYFISFSKGAFTDQMCILLEKREYEVNKAYNPMYVSISWDRPYNENKEE